MTGVAVGLAALALFAAWVAIAWRGLVAARNRAEETWGAIDARLRRRHDLVPQLADAVRDLMPQEADVLRRLEAARAAALVAETPFERADAERRLLTGLTAVTALVSRHPAPAANSAFVDLQTGLARIEDELQASRRIYNADVRLYLARRRRFPPGLLAALGTFPERPYFELDHTRDRPVALALARG
jgi:LemA protein